MRMEKAVCQGRVQRGLVTQLAAWEQAQWRCRGAVAQTIGMPVWKRFSDCLLALCILINLPLRNGSRDKQLQPTAVGGWIVVPA